MMKLDPTEYDILFRFLNSANSLRLFDSNDNCILEMRNLDKNALTFSSGGDIASFNMKDNHIQFSFESYGLGGRNAVTFVRKDGYALEVTNYKDGYEYIRDLENFIK